jgi:hypothetical protein
MYFNHVEEGKVAGVDSMGHLVRTDKRVGDAEKHVYGKMMTKWYVVV